MAKFSQDYTVRSNARRAARKAGVDPYKVILVGKVYRFPLPGPAPKAKADAKAKPARKAKAPAAPPQAKAPKATKHAAKANGGKPRDGSNRAKILAGITQPGGISMGELEVATGLLPHTLRARISEICAAEGLVKDRTRLLGTTIYTAKPAAETKEAA